MGFRTFLARWKNSPLGNPKKARRTSGFAAFPAAEQLEVRTLLSASVLTASPISSEIIGPQSQGAPELAVDTSTLDATRILVKFRTDVPLPVDALDAEAGSVFGRSFSVFPGLHEVRLEDPAQLEHVLQAYRSNSFVEYAEPDYGVYLNETLVPNDPKYGSLWGMQKIAAPTAWETETGSANTIVAVVDTGVDYNHPDLAANMWRNPGEIPGDGIDNDGNGYVDDVHGYDFVNNDANPMDDHGHGTHVAGTIGGVSDNALGVTGLNWSTQIMALKFLDSSGRGSLSNAVAAIDYAVANGAHISNHSWSGTSFSQSLYNAINAARSAGHIVVAAAGNNGANADSSPSYPAAYNLNNIISVAASGSADNLASFSNYGAMSVDLAAPGAGITSTTPNGNYASFSGTSMAAPHVAGVVALVRSRNPGWTYTQIINQVLSSVDPIASMQGKTVTGGRLNAAKAVLSGPEVQVLYGTTNLRDGASTVDLGNTSLGTPLSRTFTVKNAGKANLTVHPVSVPAGFSVTSNLSSGQVLAPGAQASFTVRFNAIAAGTLSGTLSFANSDADEGPFNFTIRAAVAESGGSSNIDFRQYTIGSYGGSAQDVNGTAGALDNGATLRLTGNTWKRIDYPYTVTSNTVLEFDFKSTSQGEVHGIGLDADLSLSPEFGFQLYGSQSWGFTNYRNYANSAGSYKHYQIPLGQFYTGAFNHLIFANDHDVANPTGESLFSNVRLYEAGANQAPTAGNDSANTLQNTSVDIHVLANDSDPDGDPLSVTGFTQPSSGSVTNRGGGVLRYTPAAGYSGTEQFSYTINDGRGKTATATVSVTVQSEALSDGIDFRQYTIGSYGGGVQDVNGTASVQDNGATLHLSGNTWKKINLPYTVTAGTVLEFDFKSTAQGEVHGIGLDKDLSLSPEFGFEMYGTQTWGITDMLDYAGSAGSYRHYQIPLGQYYTGAFNYLFFANDHDVLNPNAKSFYSNVRIYEAGGSSAAAAIASGSGANAGASNALPAASSPAGLYYFEPKSDRNGDVRDKLFSRDLDGILY